VQKKFNLLFQPENNDIIWTAYTKWLTICLNYWKDDQDPYLTGMDTAIGKSGWEVPKEVQVPMKKVN
jgi:hypothetical protein